MLLKNGDYVLDLLILDKTETYKQLEFTAYLMHLPTLTQLMGVFDFSKGLMLLFENDLETKDIIDWGSLRLKDFSLI